jgi:hypothetical protein
MEPAGAGRSQSTSNTEVSLSVSGTHIHHHHGSDGIIQPIGDGVISKIFTCLTRPEESLSV